MALEFESPATRLTQEDVERTARDLGCEAAAVWAVCDIESSGGGFLPDTRPKILFESHAFHTQTGGVYDASFPNISTPSWVRNYGASGAHQYDRLGIALGLNRLAALKSASWGMFQIMGSNFQAAGFGNVEDFVSAMCTTEAAHLQAFASFCRRNGLDVFLRGKNWLQFALGYNGPGEVQNDYHTKLREAYERRSRAVPRPAPVPEPQVPGSAQTHPVLREGSTGQDVKDAQALLVKAGFLIRVDGSFGPATKQAVRDFQNSRGLIADGVVGPRTWEALSQGPLPGKET